MTMTKKMKTQTNRKLLRITSCALAAWGFAQGAAADVAGTVLFAQPGTQIVGESGATRAAKKGDVLQTGERLVTPAGAISQLMLPDGSLVGMRPESELRITPAAAGSDSKAPVVGLISGTARVIGAELMDSKKISNFTLQSGSATVNLKGADLESAVVKADAKPTSGTAGTAPGSYQRLLVGTASVVNGNQVAALAPQQVSFVGGANTRPVTLAGNAGPIAAALPTAAAARQPGTPVAAPAAPVSPVATAVKLPNVTPPPIFKPCTRLIGKTCAQ